MSQATFRRTAPLRIALDDRDRHGRALGVAVGGLLVVAALAVAGLPPIDLHGPLHRFGVMDPLCGGTRALRLVVRGQLGAAWRYNPLGPLLVAGAAATVARHAVGHRTRRWLTLDIEWRSPTVRLLAVIAVLGLEVNQQLHASLLR
jgi:hypothetical protein